MKIVDSKWAAIFTLVGFVAIWAASAANWLAFFFGLALCFFLFCFMTGKAVFLEKEKMPSEGRVSDYLPGGGKGMKNPLA